MKPDASLERPRGPFCLFEALKSAGRDTLGFFFVTFGGISVSDRQETRPATAAKSHFMAHYNVTVNLTF